AVLGQTRPAFALSEVFTERKILLVSLAKGTLGSEAAGLLGSLVFSQLWQATQARSAIEARRRHPVMCFIDEFQDYLHLPTDLSDVLAQARGLGLGLTLAHQHLAQLTPSVRQAVLANARSRVCFQLGSDDAHAVAKTTTRLDAEDFMGLERFEVYASLAAGGQITDFGSGRTIAPPASISDPRVVRRRSRERYGQDRQAVEDQLADAVGQPPDKGGNGIGQRPRRQS
ncbi:MAG: TraM recognition domain-containing protein, partial [Candidatus Neomicrothrix subdominans]